MEVLGLRTTHLEIKAVIVHILPQADHIHRENTTF